MATLNRLAVPSFDLAWADLNDGKECLVLIPGGGGSTKSGVRNQIQVAKYDGPRGFALLKSFMTDVEEKSNFCSAISSGIIEGRAIVCAVVDDSCLIFESQRADDGGVDLSKRTEFKADFNKEFASVNCCMVASKHVLTGGEDHICRLWNISWESVGEDEVWNVKQVREMKGHAAPVMAIARHPTRPWVVTASKDGTCKIFDASNGQELINLPAMDGVDGSKRASQPMECRGCVFSPTGRFIFSIQSGKRGPSHIVKWVVKDEDFDSEATFKVSPEEVSFVSKVPLTKLRINCEGTMVAIGGSDGTVGVFETKRLRKFRGYASHDLPVTGLAFAPPLAAEAAQCLELVLSCSADNKLASLKIRKPNSFVFWVFLVVMSLVAIVAYFNLIVI